MQVIEDRKSFSVGGGDENRMKNRNDLVIPYDRNRVILTPIPGREHSTYINASFIEVSVKGFLAVLVEYVVLLIKLHVLYMKNLGCVATIGRCTEDNRLWTDRESNSGFLLAPKSQEWVSLVTNRRFWLVTVGIWPHSMPEIQICC